MSAVITAPRPIFTLSRSQYEAHQPTCVGRSLCWFYIYSPISTCSTFSACFIVCLFHRVIECHTKQGMSFQCILHTQYKQSAVCWGESWIASNLCTSLTSRIARIPTKCLFCIVLTRSTLLVTQREKWWSLDCFHIQNGCITLFKFIECITTC